MCCTLYKHNKLTKCNSGVANRCTGLSSTLNVTQNEPLQYPPLCLVVDIVYSSSARSCWCMLLLLMQQRNLWEESCERNDVDIALLLLSPSRHHWHDFILFQSMQFANTQFIWLHCGRGSSFLSNAGHSRQILEPEAVNGRTMATCCNFMWCWW